MTKLLKASDAITIDGVEFRTAAFEYNLMGLVVPMHTIQFRESAAKEWRSIKEFQGDSWPAIQVLPAFLPA